MQVNSSFYQTELLEKGNERLSLLVIGTLVLFAVYTLKLFSLQVVHGQQYTRQAERISTTTNTITPQRGEIYDRNALLPMVINTDAFAVKLTPGEIPSGYYDTVATKLAEYLGISKSYIDQKVPAKMRDKFVAIEIKTNVPFQTITNIAENRTDLPGVTWENKPLRNYVETGSISHVLGYVGNISPEEVLTLYNQGYTDNSVVGKAGIEKQYDYLLQGKSGYESRTVDANGRIISDIPIITPPEPGKNLVLTIDSSIQKLAEEALGERVGALVVLKPSNGEVLAMVSYPYYDANIFSSDNFSSEYTKIAQSANSPLMNRAVDALYPPASTFKTIMTTAILNEHPKNISPTTRIECSGKIEYGGRIFNCHVKEPGHGRLDLKNGLAQSCDVYFWEAGLELGVDVIASYAKEFGFSSSLEIDLPSQKTGFVPTAQWKERSKHQKWMGGDTLNMSIGQGYTEVTPLHVADMMAMVCNSGTIYKPHLLKEVRDGATGEVVQIVEPEVLTESTIPSDIWKQVQTDLRYTITDGTAIYPMGNRTVQIAGKTGTAEVNGYGANHWHSWMVAYAPYDAPVEEQIVVVTLVEAVNKWEWWAPYATNIVIQGYFNNQTFDQAIDALGFRYLAPQTGGRE